MLMRILVLFLISPFIYAQVSSEQLEADCLNVKNIAAIGDKHYKLKEYDEAREQYESQVAWSEACRFSKEQLATAYNNVALTYVHQSKYLKAKAWLDLLPNDKKSLFNAQANALEIAKSVESAAKSWEGEYWRYVGQSLWNVITVKKEGGVYRFDFEGFYPGNKMVYYGPNFGDFSVLLTIEGGKAQYAREIDEELSDCVYDIDISHETLSMKRIEGSYCGYGLNVFAEGLYQKTAF